MYRSTNSGTTWANISGINGLTAGGIFSLVADPLNTSRFYTAVDGVGVFRTDDTGANWTNVTTGLTGAAASPYIRLAVNASAGVVYAAIPGSGAGVVTAVFRSTDQGGTWTAMDTFLVHNGGQQFPDTSLAASPTDPNLVYLAGDRIAAGPFTSLIARGDASLGSGSQWTTIVNGNTADGSTPHADTRDMEFAANGSLLEGDDGGLYSRSIPTSSSGSWRSIGGNIQAFEVHDVAWNAVTNTIIGGFQDNGSHQQPTPGATTWNFFNGGDGGDVAVDSVSLAGSNQAIRYFSSQNLGGFTRQVTNNTNGVVSTTALAGIADPQFVTPIEINTIDPTRLLIGGVATLYESMNQGTTNASIGGPGANRVAMVYGGTLSGVPNADLIYVGQSNQVWKRTVPGALSVTTALPGGASTITDVGIDPDNYNTVFAADDNQVFMSANGGTSWSDITGNLATVSPGLDLRTVEYVSGTGAYVAVGTRSGVFASLPSSFGTWVEVGTVLPDVLVFDLEYNASDNVLVAGTLGRSVWTLPNANTEFVTSDFGDAPTTAQSGFAASYPTLLADNGARHTATGPQLGPTRDAESDGQPTASGQEQWLSPPSAGDAADEDGVRFLWSPVSASSATTGGVVVDLQNVANAKLDAWVDFNRDGDWGDAGEQILSNQTINSGDNTFNFTVPANASTGVSFARFRVSTAGNLLPTGVAADGEVEDYPVTIIPSGLLDLTFDTDGLAVTRILPTINFADHGLAIQADGKMVVSGKGSDGTFHQFSVLRYNTNGSLDTSFDGDGVVLTSFGANHHESKDVAIQSDGKIVVVGASNNGINSDFAIARYNSDGSLDSSFDGDGKQTVSFGNFGDGASSVAIDDSGRIVVAGYSNNGTDLDFAVTRLNPNGSLDNTFDGDGKVTIPIGPGHDVANAIAIQPNDRIVVVGNTSNGTNDDFGIVRLNDDGSLDSSFDVDGKTTLSFGSSLDWARDVAIDLNSKIVVVGLGFSPGVNFAIARFNDNGSLDTGFDGDGKVNSVSGSAHGVAIQSNGKIVVVGDDFASTSSTTVARFLNDGSLDTSFDGDGRLTTDVALFGNESGHDIAIQSDGKLVVAGNGAASNNDYIVFLARYAGDPVVTANVGASFVGGDLVLDESGGNTADDMTISFNGTNYTIMLAGGATFNAPGITGTGTSTLTIPFGDITGDEIIVNGGGGDDMLTIDLGDGTNPLNRKIVFNGCNLLDPSFYAAI